MGKHKDLLIREEERLSIRRPIWEIEEEIINLQRREETEEVVPVVKSEE